MENRVWVIETKGRKGWYKLTQGYSFIKEARAELKLWKKANSDEEFRIKKYVPEKEDDQ